MIPASHLRFMWDELNKRIGTPYTWGGTLDANDPSAGTDCSGAVEFVIDALVNGPQMNWGRGFWTGTFAGMQPGDVGPYGLVCIPNPGAAPPDAAAIVAINQGPTADTSHMIVRVLDRSIDPEGVDVEDGGQGLQKYDKAASITDSQFNQWFYLPGPLEQPLSRQDRYALAIIDEGRRRGISPRGIKIALAVALVETNLTMYANANVPASLAIPHDAIGSDHDSTGLFQQRQAWGRLEDTMDPTRSAGLFYGGGKAGQRGLTAFDYDNEVQSPGFYAQAVQVSAFPDRYDQRYSEAEQLFNRLAGMAPQPQQPSEEDWMANPELERMIREIHGAWFNKLVSKSRYADNQVWGNNEFIRNMDGHVFDLICEHNAALGDEWSLSQIRVAAAKGDKIAAKFLDRLTTAQTTTPAQPTPAVSPPAPQPPTPQPQPPAVQYVPMPVAKEDTNGTATTGQLIGKAYDALEALRLADALPIEGRAPLAALIAVLQTKNGSQLNA